MADDLSTQLAFTREQIAQRAEMGDHLATPRLIDHSAEFPRRRSAEAAAAELRNLGYEVTLARRGLLKVLLEASRESAVDRGTAEAFTREVFSVVAKHGGAYDGWGGPVEE